MDTCSPRPASAVSSSSPAAATPSRPPAATPTTSSSPPCRYDPVAALAFRPGPARRPRGPQPAPQGASAYAGLVEAAGPRRGAPDVARDVGARAGTPAAASWPPRRRRPRPGPPPTTPRSPRLRRRPRVGPRRGLERWAGPIHGVALRALADRSDAERHPAGVHPRLAPPPQTLEPPTRAASSAGCVGVSAHVFADRWRQRQPPGPPGPRPPAPSWDRPPPPPTRSPIRSSSGSAFLDAVASLASPRTASVEPAFPHKPHPRPDHQAGPTSPSTGSHTTSAPACSRCATVP